MCNKNGETLHQATMKDVTYLPTGHFNLFSVTKLTNTGLQIACRFKAAVADQGS